MQTSEGPALIDTNVLVYAHFEQAKYHQASRQLLERARLGDELFCVTSQVLAEFFAVVTGSRRVTTPFAPDEATGALRSLLTLAGLQLLASPVVATDHWLTLAERHQITGAGVFDLQLVGAMLAYNLDAIYTYDRFHFEPFDNLKVLTP